MPGLWAQARLGHPRVGRSLWNHFQRMEWYEDVTTLSVTRIFCYRIYWAWYSIGRHVCPFLLANGALQTWVCSVTAGMNFWCFRPVLQISFSYSTAISTTIEVLTLWRHSYLLQRSNVIWNWRSTGLSDSWLGCTKRKYASLHPVSIAYVCSGVGILYNYIYIIQNYTNMDPLYIDEVSTSCTVQIAMYVEGFNCPLSWLQYRVPTVSTLGPLASSRILRNGGDGYQTRYDCLPQPHLCSQQGWWRRCCRCLAPACQTGWYPTQSGLCLRGFSKPFPFLFRQSFLL